MFKQNLTCNLWKNLNIIGSGDYNTKFVNNLNVLIELRRDVYYLELPII